MITFDKKRFSSSDISILNSERADRVRSTYGRDSIWPVISSMLSPESKGSAKRSPLMNCEEMPPERVYLPCSSRPVHLRGTVPCADRLQPWAVSSS